MYPGQSFGGFGWTLTGTIFLHSQGILNALVYGFSKTVLKKYKERYSPKKSIKLDETLSLESGILSESIISREKSMIVKTQNYVLRRSSAEEVL